MSSQSFTPRQYAMLLDQFVSAGENGIPGTWLTDGTVPWAKLIASTAYADLDTRYATFAQGALADTAIQPGDDATLNSLITTSDMTVGGFLILPKTSGYGIKLDTAAPTFGWADLIGAISIRGIGATDPSYNVYRGGIRGYQFDPGEEVFIEFHMPHDYVPGTDIYLHFHWSLNGKTTTGAAAGTVTGGTVTWGAEATYCKGHDQAAFPAPVTFTVVSDTVSATLYQHFITEGALSASTPAASQLDSDDLEVDGLILVRAYLSANNITVGAGSQPDPFLHFVDIHYQSTGVGTKQKAPPFWT